MNVSLSKYFTIIYFLHACWMFDISTCILRHSELSHKRYRTTVAQYIDMRCMQTFHQTSQLPVGIRYYCFHNSSYLNVGNDATDNWSFISVICLLVLAILISPAKTSSKQVSCCALVNPFLGNSRTCSGKTRNRLSLVQWFYRAFLA